MKRNMDSKNANIEDIENAAAQWLLRRDTPAWTAGEQAALDQWLQASPSHRVAYIRLQSVWKHTPRLKSVAAGLPAGVPDVGTIEGSPFFALKAAAGEPPAPPQSPDTGILQATRPFRRRPRFYAVAASLMLIVLTASSGYYFWPTGTTYTTPVGGMTTVPTKDGSTITLNTASQIRVRITATERRIDLSKGEAFFEVAHDAKRPFVVHAGTKSIMAVGTKFSVRREGDNIQVIVTEGKVLLSSSSNPLPEQAESAASAERPQREKAFSIQGEGWDEDRDASRQRSGSSSVSSTNPQRSGSSFPSGEARGENEEILVPAGSIARASGDNASVKETSMTAAEESLSWRTGYVVFHEIDLHAAITEFNRYNTRQLVLDNDPTLRDVTIGGNFRTNNLDGFLRLLAEGFNIKATTEGDRIFLHRN